MDRRVTLEQVRAASALLQRRGIEVGMFLMLGYEDERESDLLASLELLKRAAPDQFLTTVAYPIKGTEFYERVAPRILNGKPWSEQSDRELGIAGRRSRRYYARGPRASGDGAVRARAGAACLGRPARPRAAARSSWAQSCWGGRSRC
jgi:radical SAM superfamily enzyme YgiQ (UPF0313 family)